MKLKTSVASKVFLLATGMIVALIFLELAVKISNLAPKVGVIQQGRYRLSTNPKIGYEPAPNLNYTGDDLSFYDWRGQTNKLGYRDYQHSAEKPQNVSRVVILGDSIGQGFYIDDYQDTLAAKLEKHLREFGKNVEVLNFSVSGYNTLQEIETLKDKALPYEPDLVLVSYDLNDTNQVDGGILNTLLAQKKGKVLSAEKLNGLFIKSHLYRFVRYKIFAPRTDYSVLSQNTVEQSLADLAKISQKKGFKVLIVVFPYFDDLKQYNYQSNHDFIKNIAVKNGFQYIDLLTSFRLCQEDSLIRVSFDTFHPTAFGNSCAADATTTYIINQKLIP